MDWPFAFLVAYLIGSIPFGLLLAMAAGKGDIRQIGSGNIGATNVLRTGSKGLAAATLLLDLAKGFAAVALVGQVWWRADGHDHFHALEIWWGFPPHPALLFPPEAAAALGAVLGHCFPVWLKFKGGKGVATNAGVSLALAWPIGLAYALVWVSMLAITRISSLAGMSAVVAAAIAALAFQFYAFVPVLTAIAALVLWLHRANIRRLLAGEEPKVGSKA